MAYCVWPGEDYSGEKCITMGLADGVSKENTLKNMGFSEEEIKKQSIGNTFIQA